MIIAIFNKHVKSFWIYMGTAWTFTNMEVRVLELVLYLSLNLIDIILVKCKKDWQYNLC